MRIRNQAYLAARVETERQVFPSDICHANVVPPVRAGVPAARRSLTTFAPTGLTRPPSRRASRVRESRPRPLNSRTSGSHDDRESGERGPSDAVLERPPGGNRARPSAAACLLARKSLSEGFRWSTGVDDHIDQHAGQMRRRSSGAPCHDGEHEQVVPALSAGGRRGPGLGDNSHEPAALDLLKLGSGRCAVARNTRLWI